MTLSAPQLVAICAASQAVAAARGGSHYAVMTMFPATRTINKWQVAASR